MARMTLLRPDGQPFRPSPTRIQDAETCMLRFKLIHLDGADEEEPSKYLTFGSTMHAVMELAHAGAEPPERSDLFTWLERYWVPHETQAYALKNGVPTWKALGYDSEDEEQAFLSEGQAMLDDYYVAHIQGNYRQAWQTEVYRQIPLGGAERSIGAYAMSVKIDRIDRLDDGRYRIIDYKTSQRAKKPDELDEDLQLLLYAWAAHEVFGIEYEEIESCGLYFLRHQAWVPTQTPIDVFMVGAALERVDRVIRQAEAGHFPAQPGWYCRFCQARAACPVLSSEPYAVQGGG